MKINRIKKFHTNTALCMILAGPGFTSIFINMNLRKVMSGFIHLFPLFSKNIMFDNAVTMYSFQDSS